jgi:hypothetical protein
MKSNRLFTNTFAGLAVAGILFTGINPVRADDQTNAAAGPATNHSFISIGSDTSHQTAGAQNYYGLPKEAFDRLSADQIMELAQAHQKTFVTEQLPNTIMTVLIPISLFSMICVCVWLGVSTRLKRNRMLHETIRQMIEKGQPIPPEILQSQESPRRPDSDLRKGLVLVGVGAGVCVLLLLQHNNSWPAGLIPLLMGVAFLITWKIEANKNGPSK